MDTSTQLVRLELEGRWSADDLGWVLISLSDLYDLRLFLELLDEDNRAWERILEGLGEAPPLRHRWRRIRTLGHLQRAQGFGGAPPILDEQQLSQLSRLFEPEERLAVRQIRYASPGFSDLAGIGTVVGHVKDLIVKLIERHDSRRQRELMDDRIALENDRLRLENARRFVALGKELGYSDTELRLLAAYVDKKQEPLIRLIDQGKLRGASTPDASSEEY